jgi:hemerythrin-like domain-containing protein
MVAKVQKAYQAELQGHFEVEETVLFLQMERHLGRLELVSELLRVHQSLRNFVKQLEEDVELHTLDGFAALLEAHVRKEERQLFVEFEKRMPAKEAVKIGREIAARLINACPRPCIDSLSH